MTLERRPLDASNMLGTAVKPHGRITAPASREDSPMQGMTHDDYAWKLDELDRLLNDWDVPMQPELVWRLLDEVSEQSRTTSKPLGDSAGSILISASSAGLGSYEGVTG
jgi:hypothetical protein